MSCLEETWWTGAIMRDEECRFVAKFCTDLTSYSILLTDLSTCWLEENKSMDDIEQRIQDMNAGVEIEVKQFLSHLKHALERDEVKLVTSKVNELSRTHFLQIRFDIGGGLFLKYSFELDEPKTSVSMMQKHVLWPSINVMNHLMTVYSRLLGEPGDSSGSPHTLFNFSDALASVSSKPSLDRCRLLFGLHSPTHAVINGLAGHEVTEREKEEVADYVKTHATHRSRAAERVLETTSKPKAGVDLTVGDGHTSAADTSSTDVDKDRLMDLKRKLAEQEKTKKVKAKPLKL